MKAILNVDLCKAFPLEITRVICVSNVFQHTSFYLVKFTKNPELRQLTNGIS